MTGYWYWADTCVNIHRTMIAAVEWIPAGRAASRPTKYEYSRAEQEFLAKLSSGEFAAERDEDGDADGGDGWEDVDNSPGELPADLRMDEYSDDEEEVGDLLHVGKVSEQVDSGLVVLTGLLTGCDMYHGTKPFCPTRTKLASSENVASLSVGSLAPCPRFGNPVV